MISIFVLYLFKGKLTSNELLDPLDIKLLYKFGILERFIGG